MSITVERIENGQHGDLEWYRVWRFRDSELPSDYDLFDVKVTRYRYREEEQLPDRWLVTLNHQCDDWQIADTLSYDEDTFSIVERFGNLLLNVAAICQRGDLPDDD